MSDITIKEGAVFETQCLFIEEEFEAGSEFEWRNWKPGIHRERQGDYIECWADGYGLVVHEVVAVVELPKPYQKRVFFKRHFVKPNFEKTKINGLMCCGVKAFESKIKPYSDRYGTYAYKDGEEIDFDEWLAEYRKAEAAQ